MRTNLLNLFLVALVPVACGPGKGATDGATESTSETTETTAPDPTTQADPTTSTTSTTSTSTTEAPTGTTNQDTTEGTDPPSFCAPAPCINEVTYDCESEIGGPCVDPCSNLEPTDCGGPDLCPPIEIKTQGSDDYEVVENEADALCVLQALRDRTPGRLQITWGDPQGFFGDSGIAIRATVSLVGTDVVRMDWKWDYKTCCIASYARFRRMQLQPAQFFDDCLADPTTENLIACFTAGSTPFQPDPDGWLPPWLQNVECDPGLPDTCGE
ncbi:hypothetical protein [Nannocystis sp. SCPEA4]|uniref:hypothetical protein n=1 Tax=Nannocystis sp. SCPEA4 TaxID=2996787 RepID=UPI002270E349|nr:hypothetical protein [Nannocystis sp. SCPEA4]MCY1054868.1 hypothetical protein [Nannocystis sp. SCPEA4]